MIASIDWSNLGIYGIIAILLIQMAPKLIEKMGHGQETNVHVEAGNHANGGNQAAAHEVRLNQHDRDIKELKEDFHGMRKILQEINDNMIRVDVTLKTLVDSKGKP